MTSNCVITMVMAMFIQNIHRRKVKYDDTTEPKWDSMSLMRCCQGVISEPKVLIIRHKNLK